MPVLCPDPGAELVAYRGNANDLPPLQQGQFWVTWAGVPGVHTVQVRSDLVVRDTEGKVRPDVTPARWLPELGWQAYVDWLTRPGGYYRPSEVELPDEAEAIPPARDLAVPEGSRERPGRVQPERPAARDEAPEHHLPERPKPVSGRDKKVPSYEAVPAKGRAAKPRKTTATKPKTGSVVRDEDDAPD